MLKTMSKLFGLVLLVIGACGFISAFTPDDKLFGIFHVDTIHNIIHLASGLVALWAGFTSYRASRTYFQIFGVIYGIVTILGVFAGSDDILGLVANNTADVWLHLVITFSALVLGFGNWERQAVNSQ